MLYLLDEALPVAHSCNPTKAMYLTKSDRFAMPCYVSILMQWNTDLSSPHMYYNSREKVMGLSLVLLCWWIYWHGIMIATKFACFHGFVLANP
jgi:hypothetical protein